MELALKILAVALVLVLGWLLTTKGLPRLVVFVGRRLGFRMRLTPLTAHRVLRFRRIRRGAWCFAAILTAFVLSLFLELLANHRALYVRLGDDVRFPAVAEWLDQLPLIELDAIARRKHFGLEGDAELDYRTFARWVRDPATLEADAAAVEASIDEDTKRVLEALRRSVEAKGETFDPATPLPEATVREHDARRAEAARLRALRERLENGEAGILMPLHPYSAREQLLHLPGAPPHPSFRADMPILGTDFRGRDVLAQLLYGFRISFAFSVVVSLIGYLIGVAVGALMGYFGGWVDIGIQRFIEIWSAIPFLFVLMIVGSILQPSFWLLAAMLIALSAWVGITFTVRGEFYREKARDYVQAAVAVGVRSPKIIGRHILPNALVPVVTFLPFEIVLNIDILVSLDFLGFGLPPGTPSWGGLLRQGADNVANHPELVLAPVLALAITLFCVVTIGEAVREAFDPKTYSRLR